MFSVINIYKVFKLSYFSKKAVYLARYINICKVMDDKHNKNSERAYETYRKFSWHYHQVPNY